MIRSATCLPMLLAAGAGLYLYQAKHQGYVLDRQIELITQSTTKVREHIAVLRAEYALLNDPSRLQLLAAAHLPTLAPLAPGQFTTLAQLDSRLPAVAPPPAPPAPLDVSASPARAAIGVTTGASPYDYPPAPVLRSVPARPVAAPLVASAAPATVSTPLRQTALAPTPAVHATAAAHRPHPASYAALRPLPRHYAAVVPRTDPLAIQAAAQPLPSRASQVASALGMARGLVAPAAVAYQRYQPGGSETLSR